MAYELSPADTRVFLFHSKNGAADGAMDNVNTWLGKDRAGTPYSNLKVRDISVTPDGAGGVFTTVVCTLGKLSAGGVSGARDRMIEE
ncbi:MAG: hypothetical protein KC435_06350 [Thermomicrobiales bacterium]|nr:hypothetical protein [Thermomicrobiales bacterium]